LREGLSRRLQAPVTPHEALRDLTGSASSGSGVRRSTAARHRVRGTWGAVEAAGGRLLARASTSTCSWPPRWSAVVPVSYRGCSHLSGMAVDAEGQRATWAAPATRTCSSISPRRGFVTGMAPPPRDPRRPSSRPLPLPARASTSTTCPDRPASLANAVAERGRDQRRLPPGVVAEVHRRQGRPPPRPNYSQLNPIAAGKTLADLHRVRDTPASGDQRSAFPG
jgi:hypothetical protein